jgi:hypothetical protein
MRILTKLQSNILDSNAKTDLSWLFEVDTDDNGTPEYYWSTKAKTYDEQFYTFKITDFTPIKMMRGGAENDSIQMPAAITIKASNANNALTPSDFGGGSILIRMVMKAELAVMEEPSDVWRFEAASGDGLESTNPGEAEICSWLFRIKSAYNEYQKLVLECQDWFSSYLEGDYPNTSLIEDLWPSDDPHDDNVCVPVLFGTSYFPVRSAYITDARYYILGPNTPTYTIDKIRSPRDWGAKSEWSSGSYTFTQSTKTGSDGNSYKVVQFIIADSDNNGSADANGLFRQGERFLDVPCKYSRNDTSSMTAPGDIIEYILEDMGVPSDKIDATSQTAANGYYSSWSLTFNIGLWYKMPRKELLARLLTMCHTELIVRDKIYFKVHDKTVNLAIEKSLVRNVTGGEGSFSYSPAMKDQGRDSGYVAYRDADEPIDSLVKILVPAKGSTTDNISKDIVHADYVQDSQNAQRIGTLAFQRRFMKDASVRFETKAKMMHLECDDILQINPVDYGAGSGSEYDILIDAMTIYHDGHIAFDCTKFSVALDNWDDLSPGAVTIAADDSSYVYEPSITGPDSPGQTGNAIPNLMKGRMRVGSGSEYIIFEPSEPLQTFVEDSITRLKIGDLGTDDFGIELFDHSGNSIMKLDGSGNKYISNITMINDLVLGDGSSNPGTITLQVAAGQGDTYISAGKTDFNNTVSGFILGIDDSDSDLAKFFVGDSLNYFNWDGLSIKLYATGSDAIEIGTGGDIKLISDDSDPGIIKFEGTSYTTTLGSYSANGSNFGINPDTDDAINFYIGDGNHMMNSIKMYAKGNIELWEEYSDNQHARIFLDSDTTKAEIDFYLKDNGTLLELLMYYDGSDVSFYPYDDDVWNLGKTTGRWKDLYLAGNIGLGAILWGTNAEAVLGIANGTVPTTSPADMIQIFSTDISGGDATLGLRTEASVVTETDESKFSHKLPVKINGTTYYIMLTVS